MTFSVACSVFFSPRKRAQFFSLHFSTVFEGFQLQVTPTTPQRGRHRWERQGDVALRYLRGIVRKCECLSRVRIGRRKSNSQTQWFFLSGVLPNSAGETDRSTLAKSKIDTVRDRHPNTHKVPGSFWPQVICHCVPGRDSNCM